MKPRGKAASLLKDKRQELGYTQKKMADLIGCTPSALCMFEKGQRDALSVERLGKACEVLGLKPGSLLDRTGAFYCTNPFCPTHTPYAIGDEIALHPQPISRDSGEGFCGWCGEVLADRCEAKGCESAFDGVSAFCRVCGKAYVSLPKGYTPDAELIEHLRTMREERAAIASLLESG